MDSKKCSICKVDKPITEFYKNKSKNDGFSTECKLCDKKRVKEYYQSYDGICARIYSCQKRACKVRVMDEPSYTKEEFINWLKSNKIFNELYKLWVLSDFDKKQKPSVDRLDDYKTYSFDNIQVLTWEQNDKKGHNDTIKGFNRKRLKAVLKYSKDGKFICEYYSIRQAERETDIKNSNITACCLGKKPTAGGFIWKHKD